MCGDIYVKVSSSYEKAHGLHLYKMLILSVECCIKLVMSGINCKNFQKCLASEILVIKCKFFSICNCSCF